MTDHIALRRWPRRLFMVATVIALTAVPSAAAAQITATPDLSRMSLGASDLPAGARLLSQGYEKGSHGTAYKRSFDVGGLSAGHLHGAFVDDRIEIEDDAPTAGLVLRALKSAFATRSGRRALAQAIVQAAGKRSRITVKDVRFRPIRSLAVGDRAFDLRLSVKTPAGRFREVVALTTVDRALGMLIVASAPRSALAQRDVALLRAMAAHMQEGLSPKSTSPPLVSGTPAVGQALSTTKGTWDPATPPSAFAYQWQHCDTAGNACVPITGAIQQSYTLTPADAGTTLRVSVSATNGAGTTTTVSAATPVIA